MSVMSGAIVVIPNSGRTMEEECDVLTPVLRPACDNVRWEVKFANEEGTEAFIDPNSTAFYSTLDWRRTPHGFDVLDLRISANALTDDASVDLVAEYLWTALLKLNAGYGYLTDMDYQLSAEWIDQNVLESLRGGNFGLLVEPTVRLLLLSRELLNEVDLGGKWTPVREGSEGMLLSR